MKVQLYSSFVCVYLFYFWLIYCIIAVTEQLCWWFVFPLVPNIMRRLSLIIHPIKNLSLFYIHATVGSTKSLTLKLQFRLICPSGLFCPWHFPSSSTVCTNNQANKSKISQCAKEKEKKEKKSPTRWNANYTAAECVASTSLFENLLHVCRHRAKTPAVTSRIPGHLIRLSEAPWTRPEPDPRLGSSEGEEEEEKEECHTGSRQDLSLHGIPSPPVDSSSSLVCRGLNPRLFSIPMERSRLKIAAFAPPASIHKQMFVSHNIRRTASVRGAQAEY